MFNIIEKEYWSGKTYNAVIWNNKDKKMVRNIITKIVHNIKPPTGLKQELTKISWKNAEVVDDKILEIWISIGLTGKLENIEHSRWNIENFYTSQQICLNIPFSEFRNEKLLAILK